jgi:hypothetical protein
MSALQFIHKVEGLRCPCCRYQLRTGPRYFQVQGKGKRTKTSRGKSVILLSSAECLREKENINKKFKQQRANGCKLSA